MGDFPFQTNPKNLDPSYKMDLDHWGCLGKAYKMDLDHWDCLGKAYKMDLDHWDCLRMVKLVL